MKIRILVLLAIFQIQASLAQAADAEIHGFISQGFILTDKNNYFGASKNGGSLDFRELGLYGGWRPTDWVRFSTLILSRTAGNSDNGKPTIDHALANMIFYQDDNKTVGLVAGRYKLPLGLYNETRDVAETRPSILLPQSIYFDNARKFLINADGIGPYYDYKRENSSTKISLKVAKTTGVNNPETEVYFLGFNFPGDLHANLAYGLQILHETDAGKRRFAAYLANNPITYKAGTGDILGSGNIMIHALWLSAYQEFDKFALTSEALLAKVRYQDFGPIISDRISHPFGWYLQGTYRPNKTIETFLRYDLSYLNRRDRAGRAFALETGKPAHGAFAKDWTIGVRYHFTPKMSLSAELHAVDGTVWLPVTDNPIPADTRQRWNLFATQFSYTW